MLKFEIKPKLEIFFIYETKCLFIENFGAAKFGSGELTEVKIFNLFKLDFMTF